MRKISVFLFLTLITSSTSLIAQFTIIENPVSGLQPFSQLQDGDAAWGDYDADGYLDLIITGRDELFKNRIVIYHNNGDGFFSTVATDTSLGTQLEGLYNSGVAWGDFDNDGDLDFVQNGSDDFGIKKTLLYKNTPGGFLPVLNPINGTDPFIGSSFFNPTWVDVNHDGKLDLFISGTIAETGIFYSYNKLYIGNGDGTFIPVETPVEDNGYVDGYQNGAAVWGDINNDGYIDLLTEGEGGINGINSALYTGKGDSTLSFVYRGNDPGSPLYGGRLGTTNMVDFDNDGDLDLYLSGESSGNSLIAFLLENDGNDYFTPVNNIHDGFRGFNAGYGTGASWGDFDGDGDSDLAYGGGTSTLKFVDVEENVGNNTFHELINPVDGTDSFEGFVTRAVEFGDYDNDGDLDLLTLSAGNEVILYQNTTNHSNTPPTAPTNLAMARTPNGVRLSWDPSTDDATPSAGLNYELRIGTTPGGSEIKTSHSIVSGANDGKLLTPNRGSVQGNWTNMNLPLGTYFWSVQAIDAGHNGSPFAAEGAFTVEEFVPNPPNSFSLLCPENKEDTLTVTPTWFSWEQAQDEVDPSDSLWYSFELSDDSLFTTILDSVTIQGDTTHSTSLELGKGKYFWRVSATNSYGLTTWASNSDTAPFSFMVTPFVPVPPFDFMLQFPLDGSSSPQTPSVFIWDEAKDSIDFSSDLMYTFELSMDSLFTTKHDSLTFYGVTSFSRAPDLPDGKYFWRVSATNSFGLITWASNSDVSPFVFYVEPFVQPAPESFELLRPTNGDTLTGPLDVVGFEWSESSDAFDSKSDLSYTFELSDSPLFETLLDSTSFKGDTTVFSAKAITIGDYYWRVSVTNTFGKKTWGSGTDSNPFKYSIIQTVSNENSELELPIEFALDQNYPNPFNPSTKISYSITNSSNVTLEVFNLLGKKVSTLVNTNQSSGSYTVNFDASNLTSGIYIYRIKAGNYIETRKMTLLK